MFQVQLGKSPRCSFLEVAGVGVGEEGSAQHTVMGMSGDKNLGQGGRADPGSCESSCFKVAWIV